MLVQLNSLCHLQLRSEFNIGSRVLLHVPCYYLISLYRSDYTLACRERFILGAVLILVTAECLE